MKKKMLYGALGAFIAFGSVQVQAGQRDELDQPNVNTRTADFQGLQNRVRGLEQGVQNLEQGVKNLEQANIKVQGQQQSGKPSRVKRAKTVGTIKAVRNVVAAGGLTYALVNQTQWGAGKKNLAVLGVAVATGVFECYDFPGKE